MSFQTHRELPIIVRLAAERSVTVFKQRDPQLWANYRTLYDDDYFSLGLAVSITLREMTDAAKGLLLRELFDDIIDYISDEVYRQSPASLDRAKRLYLCNMLGIEFQAPEEMRREFTNFLLASPRIEDAIHEAIVDLLRTDDQLCIEDAHREEERHGADLEGLRQ